MLDGRVLEASQVEYKPFGKPPLKRECSHFCRAKCYTLNFFNMSEYMSDEHVLGTPRQAAACLKCNLEPNCKHI